MPLPAWPAHLTRPLHVACSRLWPCPACPTPAPPALPTRPPATAPLTLGHGSFLQALDIDDRNPKLHFNLGLVQAQLGELDLAAQAWRDASALDPGNAEVLSSLGSVLGQLASDALNPRYAQRRPPRDAGLAGRAAAVAGGLRRSCTRSPEHRLVAGRRSSALAICFSTRLCLAPGSGNILAARRRRGRALISCCSCSLMPPTPGHGQGGGGVLG